jgi:3-oxoacyl-(acyl-carrier-protein) synthase
MRRRRVKITGIGPVTPAGIGREAFWKGIQEPVSRVRIFDKLGPEYGAFVAAQVSDFDLLGLMDEDQTVPRGLSRQSMFALAGSVLALKDAGVGTEEFRKAHAAIVIGSSLMDFGGIVGSIDSALHRGSRGAQPRALYTTGISSVPSAVNCMFGASARTMAVSTQCCAGMDAIGHAVDLVATGEVEMALCGGTEAPLHRFPMLEFRAGDLTPATNQQPEKISRPFDLWRTTGVVSEGACIFLIEPETSARAGYSYIAGYAFGNDEPGELCGGMTVSGNLAIAGARLALRDVDAINAWGPGHKAVDAGEALALMKLFGRNLDEIPATSIKGAIGMPLGAAPAVQIASAALGQRHGVIVPTVNWQFPDPGCPLNLSGRLRNIDHRLTLLNAHGVGGVNASMLLQKC